MTSETIFCPKCEPRYRGNLKPEHTTEQVAVVMGEVEHNYSGCGVDRYQCPECYKMFFVSYKVDQITEIVRAR